MWLAAFAIFVIGALEGLAITRGIDGTALAAALAAIGAIVGRMTAPHGEGKRGGRTH